MVFAPAADESFDGRPAHGGALPDLARELLESRRDRAERLLNAVRAVVLALLAGAALAYAPRLPAPLRTVNLIVLTPMIVWTAAQYLLFYRRPMLPPWLPMVNPVLDITAVTAIMAGYGLASSPALALKSPIFMAYFAILAARPIASSTRRAVTAALLAPLQYFAIELFLFSQGNAALVASPLAASAGAGISPLDEMAKLLFLFVAGAIATYATAWHERMAVSYYRQAHDREQMEVRLVHTQLESLKVQLQPHFLFNTLNTILALIRTEPATAERMVSGLSELLRASLEAAGEHEVPLERELAILRPYLEIQQVRFRDRLAVLLDVDPAARGALVPYLILQPLVENAIRHGLAPRASAGRVEISASVLDDALRLEVRDDGVGIRAPSAMREGVGLGNTRARLRHLYGTRHAFEARPRAEGGFAVRVEIPYRPAGSDVLVETHA